MQILCSIVGKATVGRGLFATACCLLALASAGCGAGRAQASGVEGQPLRQPDGVHDLNPAPNIVEFNLSAGPVQYEILPGKKSTLLGYNGQVPGPTIEANVGDQIIVHFTNNMDQATTVHWHGIRLTSDMDGGPLSQEPVPPGGKFDYSFIVPDAGLYWYHPHHFEEDQIGSGLYGALLVHGPGEPQFTEERVLVLSDVMLDDMGQVQLMDMGSQDPYLQALGMEGNTQLVNGQARPQISLRKGGRERWRVLNAATARYFKLAVPGHQLTLIGVDDGLIEAPLGQDSILLAPGERADIVLDNGDGSQPAGSLVNQSYARLYDTVFTPDPDSQIADLSYDGNPALQTPAIPVHLADIPQLPAYKEYRVITLNAKVVPELPEATGPGGGMSSLSGTNKSPMAGMDMGGGDMGGDMTESKFMINGTVWPNVPVFTVKLGETDEWEIYNHTQMDHPFHIHGFHFQVLDLNGTPWPYRGWKDTVNVPGGNSGENRLHLLVRYDGQPGKWLYHCHIIHHNMLGMMGEFDAEP